MGALVAGAWGLLAGGALVIGATIAWFIQVPARVVAGEMAFGAGVLISALAFDLVQEAANSAGVTPVDRKSTRLNSSHVATSYAVSCSRNKKQDKYTNSSHEDD